MTQEPDPNPQDPQPPDVAPDTPPPDDLEPLPQQEDLWRPPARFGSVPVEKEPMGWDRRQGFLKHYPVIQSANDVAGDDNRMFQLRQQMGGGQVVA